MAAKKGGFTKHASRVGNRVGQRAKTFVADARGGTYDQARLAGDIGASLLDIADFWGGLFGLGASPVVGVANLSGTGALYKLPGGVTTTVLLEDPVPDDAVWPVIGGALPVLQLAPLNAPGAPVDLRLRTVAIVEDNENLQLQVVFRTPGGPAVAVGTYFGTLYYESASLGAGQYFAAMVRAAVVP